MKIGDRVRFVSEVGGGRVAGFQGKNVVLVEDEDGFQVPMMVNEVVVIGQENYDTSHIVEVKQQNSLTPGPSKSLTPGPSPKERGVYSSSADSSTVNSNSPLHRRGAGGEASFEGGLSSGGAPERKGGEQLSAYLAFVPMNVKELMQTRFETFFVNDSNYYMRFTYMTAEGNSWHLRSTMEVEPNMKVFIEEFGREDLNGMERVAVQLIAYKREKPFMLKPAIDVQLRVDPVKFYKLHTFQESEFFEQPSLVYTIIENDKAARPLVISPEELKRSLNGLTPSPSPRERGVYSSSADSSKVKSNHSPLHGRGVGGEALRRGAGGEAIVVDLHASELLDTTAGMSPTDILNYQLDTFRKTLKEYEKKKGTKIIFIHGKGEGVLRKALLNELQYRYKSYTYQDASFREYGYGATQVTIK